MQPVSTMIVGRVDRLNESIGLSPLLQEICGTNPRCFTDLDEALACCNQEAWAPDLTVIWQSWSDEFSSRQILRLLSDLPLSRLVCCFSPWCESDGRNRDLWPLATRVPQTEAVTRIKLEVDVVRGHGKALPLTASRDECFEADAENGNVNAVSGNALLKRC